MKNCELKDKYDMDIIKKLQIVNIMNVIWVIIYALVYIVELYYEDSKQKNIYGTKIKSLKTLGLKFQKTNYIIQIYIIKIIIMKHHYKIYQRKDLQEEKKTQFKKITTILY